MDEFNSKLATTEERISELKDRSEENIQNKERGTKKWKIKEGVSLIQNIIRSSWDFPGGTVVKNLPASAGDMGSIPVREDPTCHGATKPVRRNY